MGTIECSICTEQLPLTCFIYNNPTDLFRTSCGHYFHRSCLSRWCQIKNNCPLCQKNNIYNLSNSIYRQNGFNINNTYNNDNIIIGHRNIIYLNGYNLNN